MLNGLRLFPGIVIEGGMMASIRRLCWSSVFAIGVMVCMSMPAFARAQIDLSVGIEMTPAVFAPGGHNQISVTVSNAGPDDAGTIFPEELPIHVYSNTFIFPMTESPPVEIVGVTSSGCWLNSYSEPRGDGNWLLQFTYYFGPIPAGTSRTCTSDIYFSRRAPARIATFWFLSSPNDTDVNPDNDRIDYVFVRAQPAQVPALSPFAGLLLGLALLSMVRQMRSKADE